MDENVATHPLVTAMLKKYARTEKGCKKVSQIIDVSIELFSSQGFEGMTLREVARRAGSTISNVQHYFASREHLLECMLTYVMLRYDASYEIILKNANCSGLEKLMVVCKYLLDDAKTTRTQGTFFELWALAHRNDIASRIKALLYKHHVNSIYRLLLCSVDHLSDDVALSKAIVIASQIEGMMVFIDNGGISRKDLAAAEEHCLCAIRFIAQSD